MGIDQVGQPPINFAPDFVRHHRFQWRAGQFDGQIHFPRITGVDDGATRFAFGIQVAHADEEAVVKSFRNLERVLVTVPEELEVAAVVWARALLVTQAALPQVEQRAGKEVAS